MTHPMDAATSNPPKCSKLSQTRRSMSLHHSAPSELHPAAVHGRPFELCWSIYAGRSSRSGQRQPMKFGWWVFIGLMGLGAGGGWAVHSVREPSASTAAASTSRFARVVFEE